jgi:hypothetical protein
MKIDQFLFSSKEPILNQFLPKVKKPNFALIFGSRLDLEEDTSFIEDIKKKYPNTDIITVSSAGTISDVTITSKYAATFVELEKTSHLTKVFQYNEFDNFIDLGRSIGNSFDQTNLVYIMLLGTSGINAEKILQGLNEVLPNNVTVSGGIAGDDERFERTLVGLNENIASDQMVALAFYGTNLIVTHGSKGGWDTFGPQRTVTKSEGNILFEIDNRPALDLYKEYLGEKASELPGSGLLFPFTILDTATSEPIVRGIQNVNESLNSIVLFGDVKNGDKIQLMRANFDRLIDGAALSSIESKIGLNSDPDFALLVSCVARKLVLGQSTEDELEEARKYLGASTKICGFYSYSELSPVVGSNACLLHNQTMTITTFTEI